MSRENLVMCWCWCGAMVLVRYYGAGVVLVAMVLWLLVN
jgi:hypothetical protein